jgi:hypothetical protein
MDRVLSGSYGPGAGRAAPRARIGQPAVVGLALGVAPLPGCPPS